jgi:hypothetical protein
MTKHLIVNIFLKIISLVEVTTHTAKLTSVFVFVNKFSSEIELKLYYGNTLMFELIVIKFLVSSKKRV